MDKILVKGTQNFLGKEIPIIEGGFGEGKRCLTDKTVAEIHGMRDGDIRRRIKDNLKRFKIDIDIIDLKQRVRDTQTLIELGYAKQSITQAEHLYLLSERGYAKLVKIMDTDLAWEIHDKLIDEYFAMREIINSDEQLKAQLLLEIYNGGQSGVLASKQLTELETKPLLDKIEKQKPKVNWFDDFLNSEGTYNSTQVAKLFKLSSAQKLNKILNEKKIIYKKGTNWLPYSDVDKSWYKLIVGSNNEHNYSQLKFSPKGVYEISKLLEIKFEEEDLKKLA